MILSEAYKNKIKKASRKKSWINWLKIKKSKKEPLITNFIDLADLAITLNSPASNSILPPLSKSLRLSSAHWN